ncbi:MAG: hypothetical protein J0I41_10050 [Filimonas sp.]|nr:hypothetical protein [Filimonas sp.]
MKPYALMLILPLFIYSCKKSDHSGPETPASCDMIQVYADNAKKQTITTGVWGTVAFMEGNCMPVVGTYSTCKTCPVKRTIRFYEYTLLSQTLPQNNIGPFYDGFTTKLVKEIETDDAGFYQTTLPAGKYSVVIVENGKLYANGLDGTGGISPVTVAANAEKINLTLSYKAVF